VADARFHAHGCSHHINGWLPFLTDLPAHASPGYRLAPVVDLTHELHYTQLQSNEENREVFKLQPFIFISNLTCSLAFRL